MLYEVITQHYAVVEGICATQRLEGMQDGNRCVNVVGAHRRRPGHALDIGRRLRPYCDKILMNFRSDNKYIKKIRLT